MEKLFIRDRPTKRHTQEKVQREPLDADHGSCVPEVAREDGHEGHEAAS